MNKGSGDGRIERKVGPLMQGYELAMTRPRMVAAFMRKHGHAPAEVIRTGSIWLAGPVGEGAAVVLENQADSDGRTSLVARVEAARAGAEGGGTTREEARERLRQLGLFEEVTR